jgi:hypothetical protein
MLMQDLDRDGVLHLDVRASIDRAHATFADLFVEAVLVIQQSSNQAVRLIESG